MLNIGQKIMLDALRESLRAKGIRATPYRIGVEAGKEGVSIPSPYKTERRTTLYQQGFSFGKLERSNRK
jgi:hypothetical protein